MEKKWYSAANFGGRIALGKAGEGEAVQLEIDVSEWLADYPQGEVKLFVTPPRPMTPYFAALEGPENGAVTWTIGKADTQIAGSGTLELLMMQGETVLLKSGTAHTTILPSPSANTSVGDAPEVHPTWWEGALEKIGEAETQALTNVEAAKTGSLESIEEAKQAAVGAVEGKFDAEVAAGKAAVEAAGSAQTSAVNSAGAAQLSAIENKGANTLASIPEEYAAIDADVKSLKNEKAPAIEVEASGSIVTVDDAAVMPVHGLVSHIVPVQEGSGDPSPENVRPIRGLDAARVHAGGKNLVNIADTTFTQLQRNDIGLFSPGTYTLRAKITADDGVTRCYVSVRRRDVVNDDTIITNGYLYPGESSYTFTATQWFDRIILYSSSGATTSEGISTTYANIQLETGSTATAYEPYQGQTLSADLPETVYGGTLDWKTGVLTVEVVKYECDGNESVEVNSGSAGDGRFVFVIPEKIVEGHGNSDRYVLRSWATVDNSFYPYVIGNTSGIFFLHPGLISAEDAKEYFKQQAEAGTPVTFTLQLATPTTIQLAPQQLEMLKGLNNVWSETGDTELVYVADTKMYIDSKISELVTLALATQ